MITRQRLTKHMTTLCPDLALHQPSACPSALLPPSTWDLSRPSHLLVTTLFDGDDPPSPGTPPLAKSEPRSPSLGRNKQNSPLQTRGTGKCVLPERIPNPSEPTSPLPSRQRAYHTRRLRGNLFFLKVALRQFILRKRPSNIGKSGPLPEM